MQAGVADLPALLRTDRRQGAQFTRSNRYAYVLSNPTQYFDPDGRVPAIIPIAGGVVGGAAS
jgi:hypothetical protein